VKLKTFVLSGGERFSTLIETNGVPAYYPTCFALNLRQRNLSHNSLVAYLNALAHILVFAACERIPLAARMETGEFLDGHEVSLLAEACSVTTASLRRLSEKNASQVKRYRQFRKEDLVTPNQKRIRLTVAADFLEMISRMSEANLLPSDPVKGERAVRRQEMLDQIKFYRPKIRRLSLTGHASHETLGKLTKYVLAVVPSSMPTDIWPNPALNSRNWAITRTLLETGIRNSELRQLKVTDVDFRNRVLTIYRRPDDPEDPRVHEPNAKTADRHIPISEMLCEFIEIYLFEAGSDASSASGSPFLFLSHSNRNYGKPLSTKTIEAIIADVGNYLEIPRLVPHDLRHVWIQNLADWSIKEDIPSAEFNRIANQLGGWSQLSKMASHYRGDQLTKQAYEKGLYVEKNR